MAAGEAAHSGSDNGVVTREARPQAAELGLAAAGEEAWIEVIRQMDRVYAELLESQVQLERKNEELEAAQDFIASVMEAMSDLMIVCDTDGVIQQVNAALERLTGLGKEALVGRPLTDILCGEDEETQARFTRHLAARQGFSDCEVLVRTGEGEPVPISINCSPRRDHRNRLVGLVLIGRPMGELQRAYRELDAALKNFETAQKHLVSSEKMAALGRLVAGVAHELNNPISFIFGNMHALKSYGEKITRYLDATAGEMTPGEMRRLREELGMDRIARDIGPLVEGTLEGAERVSEIVQDLRRFSGTRKEPKEEFALRPVIETAVSWVLRGARHRPAVTIEIPDELRLRAKRGYLHQIVVNLVQNAIDALDGRRGGRIRIGAVSEDGGLCISVEDNGPGIAADHMGKVFEPFFTTKPVGQGTGLGLYVSYRMADEIGASLSVRDCAGGGACFTLCFTADEEGAATGAKAERVPARPGMAKEGA